MNRKMIFGIVGAFVAGIVLTGAVVYQSAPSLMMLEDESPYDFDTTVERFEAAVEADGWSVLTVHDMQDVLAGHGHDVDSVKIYELCSSEYSAEILELDDERIVSPLMPCRVSIYEKSDGSAYIGRMNSELMARPFGGVINDVMQTAAVETEDVIANVLSDSPVQAADAE